MSHILMSPCILALRWTRLGVIGFFYFTPIMLLLALYSCCTQTVNAIALQTMSWARDKIGALGVQLASMAETTKPINRGGKISP